MSGVTRRALRAAGYLKIRRRDYIPTSALGVFEFGARTDGVNCYPNLYQTSIEHIDTSKSNGHFPGPVLFDEVWSSKEMREVTRRLFTSGLDNSEVKCFCVRRHPGARNSLQVPGINTHTRTYIIPDWIVSTSLEKNQISGQQA